MRKEILNLSSTKADKRGQAIFKLVYSIIGRSLEFFALQKIGMTLFVYCLLSGVAHAECVPTPDCASIGYTATSCETASLKCPFDTSKLYCLPCDSSYKYTCSGENISGGVGSACGGKYASCSCSGGRIFDSGNCIENCSGNNECVVGAIYYSDGSCSDCVDSTKTAIGVVVKDNELILSQVSKSTMMWGTFDRNLSLNDLTEDQAKEDYNGKSNTATIIAEDTGSQAAIYCNDYTTAGTRSGDWYLPATGELYNYVHVNNNAINTTMNKLDWTWNEYYLWSSSENNNYYAWYVDANTGNIKASGNMISNFKNSYYAVSCLLSIN